MNTKNRDIVLSVVFYVIAIVGAGAAGVIVQQNAHDLRQDGYFSYENATILGIIFAVLWIGQGAILYGFEKMEYAIPLAITAPLAVGGLLAYWAGYPLVQKEAYADVAGLAIGIVLATVFNIWSVFRYPATDMILDRVYSVLLSAKRTLLWLKDNVTTVSGPGSFQNDLGRQIYKIESMIDNVNRLRQDSNVQGRHEQALNLYAQSKEVYQEVQATGVDALDMMKDEITTLIVESKASSSEAMLENLLVSISKDRSKKSFLKAISQQY